MFTVDGMLFACFCLTKPQALLIKPGAELQVWDIELVQQLQAFPIAATVANDPHTNFYGKAEYLLSDQIVLVSSATGLSILDASTRKLGLELPADFGLYVPGTWAEPAPDHCSIILIDHGRSSVYCANHEDSTGLCLPERTGTMRIKLA